MSGPPFPLDPGALAEAIGIPLEDWPGNCHGVAEAVLRHAPTEGMRLVRGHFTGHVDRDSVYHRGGLQQHSWLRLEDGRILDPTRWAITSPKRPHIYVGVNDDYDEGGLASGMRARPQIAMSMFLNGGSGGPEDVILKKLAVLPREKRELLAELSDVRSLTAEEVPRHAAESLKMRLDEPVEHIRNPEAFYGLIEEAGLKALIKIDNWVRVMEPEKVTPRPGANMVYADPPADEMTDPQRLFKVFAKFLSIEERDLYIEDELAEFGYTLDELHEALNEMEGWLRYDPELPYFPREHADLICVVASDLLGKGFGEDVRVERFADSVGLDRDAFHNALVAFSKPVGFDLVWLIGEDARIAEASVDDLFLSKSKDDVFSP
ncbi:MAG: hypothetical protein ABJN42_13610 [Roseibium sp.]|uniref:hypothetical protein n=1 Tax=Roseibium sp. TaxID=1936156 RepID=UPI003297B382